MTLPGSRIIGHPMEITLPGAGLNLSADVAGPDTGDPVVLLHGGGQTRGAWGKTISALAALGFRAYAVDLRGHGESDWAEGGDYRIEAAADDLRQIVHHLGRPAFLVGASLGGLAAMLAAGEAPRLDPLGIVLVDVSPNLLPEGVGAILGFMRATVAGFDSVAAAADAISAYLPHRPRPSDLTGLRKNLKLGADGRYHWHWDPRTLDHIVDPVQMNHRLNAAALQIACPALLIRGAQSELVTEAAAADFMKRFAQGRVMDIPNTRHMVAGDSNTAFSDALVSFITAVAGAGAGAA
jgi:pimeloyl-ACP methyl ester carboxylesterase